MYSIGLNSTVGAQHMFPFIEHLVIVVECFMHVHSNAGLPITMGRYDMTPADMSPNYKSFFENGWLNIWLEATVSQLQHTSSVLARRLPSTSLSSSMMLVDQRCGCLDWRTLLLVMW